jgi:transcriptional regulator GlxA family with amidase domain
MKKPTEKFRRTHRTPRIGALVYENALASSVTLPSELAMAASQASGRRTLKAPVTLYSPGGGTITTSGGVELVTQPLSATPSLDLLVVAAIWRDPRRVIKRYPELIQFLTKVAAQGTTMAAVGTGSFLLAETGLLDKKPATTHWFWFDEFATRYPAVDLRRRFKSAQLGSHLVREHRDEVVLDVQLYLQEKLANPLSMASIAKHFGLSERTLTRRFQRAAGTTPWQYLLSLRLSEAESLLRTSNLSITEVAAEIGILDSAHFARQFKKINRLSPSEYRKAVRGKVFSPI